MEIDDGILEVKDKFLARFLMFHSFRLGESIETVAKRMADLSRLVDLDDPGWPGAALAGAGVADEMDVNLADPNVICPLDTTRASIPRLIVLAVDLDRPLWCLHDRLVQLAPVLGYGPPPPETTYLGIPYGELVEQSRRDHPPGAAS